MKSLIYSIVSLIYCVICFATLGVTCRNHIKGKTSRRFKVIRNLSVVLCICAIIACLSLSSFSFSALTCSILEVLIWLYIALTNHKNMQEYERKEDEFLKTHPIDVEFKELN